MFANQKKRENVEIKNIFCINLNLKDRLDRIHSLLRRADARESADIIHYI